MWTNQDGILVSITWIQQISFRSNSDTLPTQHHTAARLYSRRRHVEPLNDPSGAP